MISFVLLDVPLSFVPLSFVPLSFVPLSFVSLSSVSLSSVSLLSILEVLSVPLFELLSCCGCNTIWLHSSSSPLPTAPYQRKASNPKGTTASSGSRSIIAASGCSMESIRPGVRELCPGTSEFRSGIIASGRDSRASTWSSPLHSFST